MRRRTAAGSAVFLMMYMLAVVLIAPSAARATHVVPVLIPGNQNCAAATGTAQLIKLEGADLSDGTYQVEGGSVTVDIGSDGVFDWWSTVTIAAVFAKGGTDGNLYDYRPLNGATSDQGLHAPDNDNSDEFFGLSHITFCKFDSPTTTTASTTSTTSTTAPPTTAPPTTTPPTTGNPTPAGVSPEVSVLGTVLEPSTTVAAVSASTLPFTGFELENTLLLAVAALMSGVGLLLLTVGNEKETATPVHDRW